MTSTPCAAEFQTGMKRSKPAAASRRQIAVVQPGFLVYTGHCQLFTACEMRLLLTRAAHQGRYFPFDPLLPPPKVNSLSLKLLLISTCSEIIS